MGRKDNPSGREIDGMLQKLEQRIDTLKKRYERFFLGVERRPPTAMRKQVVREVFELEQTYINNTAQKFRLRSLVQRFNTHKTRWNRIMRQIEEGTYHRDRKKAQRRRRQQQEARQRQEEKQEVFELNPEEDLLELNDMDMEEIFNEPRQPQRARNQQPARASAPSNQKSKAEQERIKQQRLAEIQAKLGLSADQGQATNSGGAGQGGATQPQRTSRPSKNSQSSGSSRSARDKKLEEIRRKLEREKQQQSPQRSSSRGKSGGRRRIVRRSGSNKSSGDGE